MAETDYPIDPKTGRIDVPCFPPNTPGNPSRQVMRLGMVGGRRADTDATVAPISDVNNFVMLPDGSGMRVRDGFAYTAMYAIQTSPAGRQALVVETAPWNIPISFRHMIMPTGTGIPYVSEAEYIRDRSQAIGDSAIPTIYFGASSDSFLSPDSVTIGIARTDPLGSISTVNYATRDGTAIAGVHYTAMSGTAAFPYDSKDASTAALTIAAGAAGLYMFIDLSEPTNGRLGQYSSMAITFI